MRTIIVGDIHGCSEELDELLKLAEFRKGTDRLIFAGDLIDRGSDSLGVLRRARELGAEAVMGNHDEKHVRYHNHELRKLRDPLYDNPMNPYTGDRLKEHLSFTDDDWAFLGSLPHWLRVNEKMVVVHAGVMPGIRMEKQLPNDCVRLRYVKTDVMKMAQADHVKKEPKKCVLWTELWTGPDSVIYGHIVNPRYLEKDGQAWWTIKPASWNSEASGPFFCLGIDAGCCFGGWLTAAIVEGATVPTTISVRAKRVYHPLQGWVE